MEAVAAAKESSSPPESSDIPATNPIAHMATRSAVNHGLGPIDTIIVFSIVSNCRFWPGIAFGLGWFTTSLPSPTHGVCIILCALAAGDVSRTSDE